MTRLCSVSRLLFVLAATTCASPAADASQAKRLPVQVVINDQDHGQAVALLEGDELWLPVATLQEAGINVDARAPRTDQTGRSLVRLGSLSPALTYRFDAEAIVVTITASPSLFSAQTIDMRGRAGERVPGRRRPSAFLNYGVSLEQSSRPSLVAELGTSINGILVTGTAYRAGATGWSRGPVRLTYDDHRRLRRWIAGDDVVSTGSLGQAVPLVGVSVSRAFEINPYYIPLPSLNLSGATSLPATVDVYVNDQLVRRESLRPGAFTLDGLTPGVGDGVARVVVRDLLGREQVLDRTFYQPASLLARGVHGYSYSVGRRRDGLDGWADGPWVLAAAHRVGVSDDVTLGGRLEATGDLVSTGSQVSIGLPRGELEIAGSGSVDERRRSGVAGAVAYNYLRAGLSAGGFVRVASRDYLGAAPVFLAPERLDASLYAGASVTSRVSLTVRVEARSDWAGAERQRVSLTSAIRLSTRLGLSVSYAEVGDRGRRGRQLGATMTYVASPRTTATVTTDLRADAPAGVSGSVQRALPTGAGYGYRLQTQQGPTAYLAGEIEAQNQYGKIIGSNRSLDGRQQASVGVAGGVALIGGSLHATRPIDDAFLLVRVPDRPGVRTYVAGQDVGRTNRRGELLVPGLLSYYDNQVRIAAEDVAIDAMVDGAERTVSPPLRGGAVVTFAASRVQRVLGRVRLRTPDGLAVPRFGDLSLAGGQVSPLGRDGEFYFENLAPGRQVGHLQQERVRYSCTFEILSDASAQISVGVVVCDPQPEQP